MPCGRFVGGGRGHVPFLPPPPLGSGTVVVRKNQPCASLCNLAVPCGTLGCLV